MPLPSGRPTSISASADYPLIGALSGNRLVADASVTANWLPIGNGTAPAYPG